MTYIEDIDVIWMHHAITLAGYANICGEIPVGAVLICNNRIIGYGWNMSKSRSDPSAHAEIMALRNGGKMLRNYRLLHSTLYVTMAPCMMCLGAIVHARIYRLVYGASSHCMSWAFWSRILLNYPKLFNHRILLTVGVLKFLCEKRLSDFFKCRR